MSLILCGLACFFKSWGHSDSGGFLFLREKLECEFHDVWERPAPFCCLATHISRDPEIGDLNSRPQ